MVKKLDADAQWHFKTHAGAATAEPVVHDLVNIKEQEAVPAYDKKELLAKAPKLEKLPWPTTLADHAKAVRTGLAADGKPVTAPALTKTFKRAGAEQIEELLDALVPLGQARAIGDWEYVA